MISGGDDDDDENNHTTLVDGRAFNTLSLVEALEQGMGHRAPSSNKLERDGRQESWKDIWVRFKSTIQVSLTIVTIHQHAVDPDHTPVAAARIPALPRARRPAVDACLRQARQDSPDPQGYESAKGSCANDGFAALHAIIKVYEVRPAPRGRRLRVENELRIAI